MKLFSTLVVISVLCIAKGCDDFSLDFGNAECDGNECHYSCNNGWELLGFESNSCVDGEWLHPHSMCNPMPEFCGDKVNGVTVKCPKLSDELMDRMLEIFDAVSNFEALEEIHGVQEDVEEEAEAQELIRGFGGGKINCASLCKMPCPFFVQGKKSGRARRNAIKRYNQCIRCRKERKCPQGYRQNVEGIFTF